MHEEVSEEAQFLKIEDYDFKYKKLLFSSKIGASHLVKKNGLYLSYLSSNLQQDKNIVLKAVSQNGLALMFASNDDLKKRFDMEKSRRSIFDLKLEQNKNVAKKPRIF